MSNTPDLDQAIRQLARELTEPLAPAVAWLQTWVDRHPAVGRALDSRMVAVGSAPTHAARRMMRGDDAR